VKRIEIINFAKTMLFFSLVVVFSGIAFDFNNSRKLINPKEDTYLLAPSKNKDGTISITTIDPNDVNGGKPVTENSSNNNSSNSSNTINNSNTVNNNQNIINDNSQSKIVLSGEEVNSRLRTNIQNKFGINVKYGSETDGYSVSDMKVVSLSDTAAINNSLTTLNNLLSLYPNGLFSEIKNDGYDLTIYLLKKYSVDNVTGITDSINKRVIISVATDYQFSESLHHEIYHYMENYMYTKGARYTTWNNLNPTNFKYGKHKAELSYSYTRDSNAYFVNNYSQTAAEEDRASTFEYMTADSKSGCLEQGKPIWLKAKYMCEQIDTVFDSVSPNKTEFWERYVY